MIPKGFSCQGRWGAKEVLGAGMGAASGVGVQGLCWVCAGAGGAGGGTGESSAWSGGFEVFTFLGLVSNSADVSTEDHVS